MAYNHRRSLSKYQIGNMLFKLLCLGFGMLTFLYLSFSIQFFYEITPLHGTYYLFLSGWFFLILGFSFLVFRSLKRIVNFGIFIYVGLSLFLLLYWGSIFIHAYPQIAMYLFVPIYLALGLLLFLFLSLWKREGGIRVLVYFFIGVFISGVLNRFHPVSSLLLINVIKIVLLVFCLFIGSYLLGFFGIFKERRYSFAVATVLVLLSVFYPIKTENLIEELNRYKWQEKTKLLGAEYDYVGSYQSLSRKVDAFISNNNSKESFAFVENGTPILYTYPLKEEHELSFNYALVQQQEPLKSILVVGDVPVGFISVLNKLPENVFVQYMPVDSLYPAFWSDFIHEDLFKRIKIINDAKDLLPDYNLVFLFPPNIKGVGSFSYINKKQFEMIRKHMTVGSLIIVTSKVFPVGVENIIRNNIDGLFRNVAYLKLISDINFIVAADDIDNITSTPATLKYRFLQFNTDGDYSKMKNYFETNTPVVSSHFGVMDNAGINSRSAEIRFMLWFMVLGFILFWSMYLTIKWKPKGVGPVVNSINTLVLFFIIGGVFGNITLYHQRMFVDLHTTFCSLLAIFLFGIISGTITGALLDKILKVKKIFLISSILFVLLIVTWMLSMNHISSDYVLIMFLVWTGFTSMFIYGTRYWYRLFLSLDNTFRLVILMSLGLGWGILADGFFDFYHVSLSATNYSLASLAAFFILYNILMLREKRI